MMRSLVLCTGVTAVAAAGTTLTINVGTQKGSFMTGDDVGELNAHDYRPGEFVTNDFIYEVPPRCHPSAASRLPPSADAVAVRLVLTLVSAPLPSPPHAGPHRVGWQPPQWCRWHRGQR